VTSDAVPGLMGAAEIGRLLGVSRQRVQQLVNTDGFPPPVAVLDMGKVWRADDVRAWATARGRRRQSADP
jgi:prophage regulatory protein